MIMEKVKEMKQERGLSNKQLSDISGVPLATVNRIMADMKISPNFQTVCDLVTAMGGSLDELAGIAPPSGGQQMGNAAREEAVHTPSAPPVEPARPPLDIINIYEALLSERAKELETRDRWLKVLFITCAILVTLIIGILIFDLLNPAIGFFTH